MQHDYRSYDETTKRHPHHLACACLGEGPCDSGGRLTGNGPLSDWRVSPVYLSMTFDGPLNGLGVCRPATNAPGKCFRNPARLCVRFGW